MSLLMQAAEAAKARRIWVEREAEEETNGKKKSG